MIVLRGVLQARHRVKIRRPTAQAIQTVGKRSYRDTNVSSSVLFKTLVCRVASEASMATEPRRISCKQLSSLPDSLFSLCAFIVRNVETRVSRGSADASSPGLELELFPSPCTYALIKTSKVKTLVLALIRASPSTVVDVEVVMVYFMMHKRHAFRYMLMSPSVSLFALTLPSPSSVV